MQLGATAPPQLSCDGKAARILSFLGVGATSTVYKCELLGSSSAGGSAEPGSGLVVAAKVARPGFDMQHERLVLTHLEDKGCAQVPRVVGYHEGPPRALYMQPVGTPLTPDIMQVCQLGGG
jgi:hypothetical protein